MMLQFLLTMNDIYHIKLIDVIFLQIIAKNMQEITKENLIHGKEYYLEAFTTDENDNFVRHSPRYKMIAKFDKIHAPNIISGYKFSYFTNFREISCKNKKNCGYDVRLNNFWRFYEIIEDKVQSDMERRSYNIILQKIVKDEYFRLEFI